MVYQLRDGDLLLAYTKLSIILCFIPDQWRGTYGFFLSRLFIRVRYVSGASICFIQKSTGKHHSCVHGHLSPFCKNSTSTNHNTDSVDCTIAPSELSYDNANYIFCLYFYNYMYLFTIYLVLKNGLPAAAR